jgi:hypothetical protein
MEVLLESEEQMGRNKRKRRAKRERPNGPPAPSPAAVADQTGRLLAEREHEWLERLTTDPASFAAVEREVHEQAQRQADLYVAGLLAKASEQPETAPHIDKGIGEAEVQLRPVANKDAPWWSAFWLVFDSCASVFDVSGQVPRHPEQSKGDALASATTSRTLIADMCSAQHEAGGAPAVSSHSQNRLCLIRWTTSLIIG